VAVDVSVVVIFDVGITGDQCQKDFDYVVRCYVEVEDKAVEAGVVAASFNLVVSW
tara:strand:+ start:696 stop:860 length:165 start_codon:yes stop_codon:yes gene_type:complete